MKTTLILITLILCTFTSFSETKEPCKGVVVPTELKTKKIIFEIPTYDEYVHTSLLNGLASGMIVEDDNLLNEVAYKKIRNSKIKTIKSTVRQDYDILTKKEVENLQETDVFIFQEKFITEKVKKNSIKFEEFNAFSIKDMSSSREYTLVDPSNDTNCLISGNSYKFADLVEIIQK